MLNIFVRPDGETINEALFRLGTLKQSKAIDCTWDDVAAELNDRYSLNYCESRYRKLFGQLNSAVSNVSPLIYSSDLDDKFKTNVREIEKQRIRIQKERNEYRKDIRAEALYDQIFELFDEKLERIDPIQLVQPADYQSDTAVYALLSDIHYGIEFKSSFSEYNPEIAKARVLYYAFEIVRIGKINRANTVYVSLLGDLVSGIIHDQIRLENSRNIIEQVMEVSEIITAFLKVLAQNFSRVYVNSVSGNHSRLGDKDIGLRTERLDDLVIWYCKSRFENINNVIFNENIIDPTIGLFNIFGKNYVSVHGDYDKDMKEAVHKISDVLNKKSDCFVAGHMHIGTMRCDNVTFIQNGAVLTGGDDYTAKHRLFGPAVQICMTCDDAGIKGVFPVKLGGIHGPD